MSLLSTILIAVCDVIIVLCFVFLYRRLERRVLSLRADSAFIHDSICSYVSEFHDIRALIASDKREIESLRTDVRKLESTKKTTKKSVKNVKVK